MSLIASIALCCVFAGEFVEQPSDRRIDKCAIVYAPLAEVWKTWTTKEGLSFIAEDAKIELRVGGAYEWYFSKDAPEGQRGGEGCKVLSFVPQQQISFSWNAPPTIPALRDAGAKTQVCISFRSITDEQTMILLSQHGLGEGKDWDDYYIYFQNAWSVVMLACEEHFDPQGVKKSAADRLEQAFVVDAPLAKVWADLTTKEGLESWMVPHAEIDLRSGGRATYSSGKDGDEPIVIAFDYVVPQRIVSQRFLDVPKAMPDREVMLGGSYATYFEPLGANRTLLRFEATGYDASESGKNARERFFKSNTTNIKHLSESYAGSPR